MTWSPSQRDLTCPFHDLRFALQQRHGADGLQDELDLCGLSVFAKNLMNSVVLTRLKSTPHAKEKVARFDNEIKRNGKNEL